MRFLAVFSFTLERLNQHRLLALWVLIGLSVATTLALSLALYVDAVYSDLLVSRLPDPPYAIRLRYLGAWNGTITRNDVDAVSAAVEKHLVQALGMPVQRQVHFVRGGSWSLRQGTLALGTFGLGTLDGADDQITITAGQWPPSDPGSEALPVLAPDSVLYGMGLQVGDELDAQRAGGGTLKLKIAALWRPVSPDDPTWIFPPKYFDTVLLVLPADLERVLAGAERPIDEAAWFLVFDGARVRASQVDGLLDRMRRGQRALDAVLPGLRRDLAPVEELEAFNREVNALAGQLTIIVAPVGGLVLYFVALVADLLVRRQQIEDVKLRSRGMSRRAVLAIHVLMWLLLVGAALGIGVIAVPPVVRLVERTTSFLRFSGASTTARIALTPSALGLGALTGLIAASSGLAMAWQSTRQNLASLGQVTQRPGKAWWQRAYLDLLLLIPASYVLYTLEQRGGLVTEADTPFSDPLAFAGPTLFALGLVLLFLRLWPLVLGTAARLISVGRGVALLMALRELTRAEARYRGVLLLMAFTLSLTGFTASMASTLDRSLSDTIDYRVGADLVIETAVDVETESDQDSDTGQTTFTLTGYHLPPVEDLLALDGVAAVSRIGRYPARLVAGTQPITGAVVGVDRAALAAVARFRADYAAEPLSILLNKLAGERTGLIVSRQTADTYHLEPGQEVTLQLQALDTWYDARVRIIDVIDYFPTLDPAAGFFAITNLDPLFELAGTALPHDFWLRLAPGTGPDHVLAQLRARQFPVLGWSAPATALAAARAEPARRGVLGFLSVGFVASVVLTLIASIVQSAAAFRSQATQLGALRAIGLSGRSVGLYVILSQGLAALGGIAGGTSIGVLTTLLFLPLLDFSGGLPPYLVRVAWDDIVAVYAVFAGVLLVVTLLTTLLLSRTRVATIIRLGEA